jgi:hypothetical protein
VGTKSLPEYHFYYLDNGNLAVIRLDDIPKPDNMPWPVVWRRKSGSMRLLTAIIGYIRKGKATHKEYTEEKRWRGHHDDY